MKKYFKIFQIIFISLVYLYPLSVYSEEKIKIGLLVPMTGDDKKLGKLIIESVRIALKDINTNQFQIIKYSGVLFIHNIMYFVCINYFISIFKYFL